jgi:hypothetical protein
VISSLSMDPSPVEKLNDKFEYRDHILTSPPADVDEDVDVVGIEFVDVGTIENLIQAFDEERSDFQSPNGSIQESPKPKRGRPRKSASPRVMNVSTKLIVDTLPALPESSRAAPAPTATNISFVSPRWEKSPPPPLKSSPPPPRRQKRKSAGKPPKRYLQSKVLTRSSGELPGRDLDLNTGRWKPMEDESILECDRNGMSLDEIAALVRCPPRIVKNRLQHLAKIGKVPITLESLTQKVEDAKSVAKELFREREVLWHFPSRKKFLKLERELISPKKS